MDPPPPPPPPPLPVEQQQHHHQQQQHINSRDSRPDNSWCLITFVFFCFFLPCFVFPRCQQKVSKRPEAAPFLPPPSKQSLLTLSAHKLHINTWLQKLLPQRFSHLENTDGSQSIFSAPQKRVSRDATPQMSRKPQIKRGKRGLYYCGK